MTYKEKVQREVYDVAVRDAYGRGKKAYTGTVKKPKTDYAKEALKELKKAY